MTKDEAFDNEIAKELAKRDAANQKLGWDAREPEIADLERELGIVTCERHELKQENERYKAVVEAVRLPVALLWQLSQMRAPQAGVRQWLDHNWGSISVLAPQAKAALDALDKTDGVGKP